MRVFDTFRRNILFALAVGLARSMGAPARTQITPARLARTPDVHGDKVAFTRMPIEHHNWKRYRGGMANHVWIADLDKKTFRRIDDGEREAEDHFSRRAASALVASVVALYMSCLVCFKRQPCAVRIQLC